jgi:hypothetical protein
MTINEILHMYSRIDRASAEVPVWTSHNEDVLVSDPLFPTVASSSSRI